MRPAQRARHERQASSRSHDLHDDVGLRDAYQAHGPELYRFARRALHDNDAARDAVQETFLRAWRAFDRYDPAVGSLRVGYAIAPKPPELPLEPVAVRVSTPSVESTAEVIPHTWGMEIKLTGSGFDPGMAYRVLVRARDGREVNAGEFVGTWPATMHCNLNTSVLRADAVGFRVVDEDGQEVMTSSLL
jgi:hypothetical protein